MFRLRHIGNRHDHPVTITCVETAGFFSDPISQEFLQREHVGIRLRDIVGEDINSVLAAMPWQFTGIASCVMALDDEDSEDARVCALAWATPTNYTGAGLNLTYAVARGYQGRGLARDLSVLAVRSALQYQPDATGVRVHAQWDEDNIASARVATALGLRPAKSLAITVPLQAVGGAVSAQRSRTYIGAGCDIEVFRRRHQATWDTYEARVVPPAMLEAAAAHGSSQTRRQRAR